MVKRCRKWRVRAKSGTSFERRIRRRIPIALLKLISISGLRCDTKNICRNLKKSYIP